MAAEFSAGDEPIPAELEARIAQTRADYERWLDARYAAARGHVDALIDPLRTTMITPSTMRPTIRESAMFRTGGVSTITMSN